MLSVFRKAAFGLFLLLPLIITIEPVQAQVTGFPNPAETIPREFQIANIEVSGEETRSANMIIATSGLQVGERIIIPGAEIGEAIKRLFRTGLFSDVQILETSRRAGQIHLLIQVREQPRLESFEIVGPRRSERRDLRDMLPLIPGFAVTDATKSQSVNIIKRYFRDKGYRFTEVEIIETQRDELRNTVRLKFDIDRGERIQIREIVFEGNENFSDARLRRQLKTIKRTTFWRSLTRQTFNRADFAEAKENLGNFYRQNGFRDFRVVEDSVYVFDHRRNRQGIGVFLNIYEGPQYFVRNITFDGNTVHSDERLLQALDFEKGDVFDEQRFRENIGGNRAGTDIYALYYDIGYVFLEVQDEITVVGRDSLDIHIQVVEDEKATVRLVEFMGNTKTHDHVVRRNLRSLPGAYFSRSLIQRSMRELAQLGYFNPQNILPDIEPNYEDKTVDIYFSLDETAGSDNFELSGGFGGRQLGVILSARVNFNNFSARNFFDGSSWRPLPSGDGQRLSLGVQLTGRGYQSYNFGFQEPWFRGRPNSLGFNIFYSRARLRDVFGDRRERFENFGASVSLGRRLQWPDDYFTQFTVLSYQYFSTDVNRGFIRSGTENTISLRLGLERNSLDNPISPNFGSRFSASFEMAPPLPGFRQYHLSEIKFQQHIPIVGRLVLTSGFDYGYLGWFSSANQSQFQRFYLGGTMLQQQQTFYQNNIELRGFPGGTTGSITPYDGNIPLGGTIYQKYSAELRYPAVTNEQIQLIPYVFAEGGNAFRNFDEFDPFDVKRSVGLGTRIFLPILGLIDLSYGYRLDGIPNTRIRPGNWEFLFNIGAPF